MWIGFRKLDLLRDGVQVFRKVLDPEWIRDFKAATDYSYDLVSGRTLPDPSDSELIAEIAGSSARWGGIPTDHCKQLARNDKAFVLAIDNVIERVNQILSESTQGVTKFRPEISNIRRHKDHTTFAPWHNDAYAAGTLNFDPVFNAWVPFIEVGKVCPGLEVIVGSSQKMRAGNYEHQQTGGPADPGYPTPQWLEKNIAPKNHIVLKMKPGDVAIFDHYTLHRTQVKRFPPYVRTSVELRFSLETPSQ